MASRSLTYKVLQDSTNDFSDERRIGEGAYGEVYLGMLENGEEVAVKRLYNRDVETNDQQFTHEFENLMRVDHPNIVRLVGYCYETQHIRMPYGEKTVFAQQTCRALCFEYMQKGSLEKHLSDEHGGLDWPTRYKIIKETCEGLKHLHEGGLYHLDLKPDNILLDVNMVAKLADFGVSKIFGDEQNKDPKLVIGTLGYLPPEYIAEKLVTKKLDIFSLGVVMTKIIAGPEGHARYAEMSNQKFLRQVNENWRNRLKARWNSPGSFQAYCKQVNECTKIAMKCIDYDRNVRPSIVDIINKLNKTEHSIATKLWLYAPVDADARGKRKTEHNQPPPVSSTSALVRPDAPPPLHAPTSSVVSSSATPIPPAPSHTTLQHKLFYSQPPLGLLKITERVYVFASCLMADVLYDDNYRQYIRDIVLQVRSDYNNAHVKVFNFREGQGESLLSHVLSSYEITVMEYPMQYEGCPLLTMEMIHRFLKTGEIWLSMEQHNVLIMHCERGGLAVLAFMLAGLLLYQKQCTGEQTTLEMVYANAPRWLIRPLSPLNHMPSQIRYLQYISQRNVRYKWPPGERQLTLGCVTLRTIPDFNDEVGCRPIFRIHGQEPLLGLNDPPKVLFSTPKEYVRLYKQANDDQITADIRCHLRGDVVLECINMDLGQERDVTMFRIMFNTAFIRSRILTLDRDQIDTMWYSRDRFPRDFRAEIFFSEISTANQLDPMGSSIQEKKGLQLAVEYSKRDEALVQQPANSPEIIELRKGFVSPPPPASTSSTVRPDACFGLSELPQLCGNAITLPRFMVHARDGESGSNLFILNDTNPDELEISRLENVKSAEEAEIIKLVEKQRLLKLTLVWSGDAERFVDDSVLLEKLVPPSTVEELTIEGYNGVSFPAWLTDQLPTNLARLELRNMEHLEEWNTSYSSSEEEHAIKHLRISDCPKLRMKPLPPRAEWLTISNSDNVLSPFGQYASSSSPVVTTTGLTVAHCNLALHQWSLLHHLPGLTQLSIERCGDLTVSPRIIKHLNSLTILALRYLQELPEWLGELSSLRELEIDNCGRIKELHEKMRQLTQLKSLTLSECHSLASLPHWLGELTSLKALDISRCDGIRSLPKGIQQLANLRELHISFCPGLKQWCESEENIWKSGTRHTPSM